MPLPSQYLSVDENGRILKGESIVQDPLLCRHFLENIRFAENGAFCTSSPDGDEFFIEAFDEPLIAEEISLDGKINVGYSVVKSFDMDKFTVDEWDRFHGITTDGIPFVLTSEAQDSFFDAVDGYDDDGFTYKNKYHAISPWLMPTVSVETAKFWTDIYKTGKMGWDLGEPATAFVDMVPRLKFPKSRILVLGSGYGHDAAYFAKLGHIVTAVDFSQAALDGAQARYPDLTINWHKADVFELPREWAGQFDLIIEQTCYCAIEPARRNSLLRAWMHMLQPQGQLLGVFFSMEKRNGEPPYGGSEWEVRERLKKNFQFLFWGRWHKSPPNRAGKEFLVFAQRK